MAEQFILNNTFRILHSEELPDFEKTGVEAFAAERLEEDDTGKKYMALVGINTQPPRLMEAERMSRMLAEYMLPLQEYGLIVDNKGAERPTLVYEQPGGKVVSSSKDTRPAMKEVELRDTVVKPILATLREYHARDMTHRSVRPDNMFYSTEDSHFILGDALMNPPGSDQPAWVETIENASTHPLGRGRGVAQDDMYNFGATVLYFALGECPTVNMEKDKLVLEKIDEDSFTALMGKHVVSRSVENLIAGLLNDDPTFRWTLEDVDNWVKKAQSVPRQMRRTRRASRPFPFGGFNHLTVKSLAYGFSRDFMSGIDAITSKALDRWVRRSVGDEKLADEIEEVVGLTLSNNPNKTQKDNVMAKVLILMDRAGPLYHSDFSFNIDGIGPLYHQLLHEPEKLEVLTDMIQKKYPILWLETRTAEHPVDQTQVKQYDTLSNYRVKKGAGFGKERVLYDLNPNLPCQSPIVSKFYVTDTVRLLQVLDIVYGAENAPNSLIDNHIIAFLASKHRTEIKDVHLLAIHNNTDMDKQNFALVRLLGKAQMFTNVGPLPGLCKRISKMLRPTIEGVKNIERKKRMMKMLEQATQSGDINRVLAVTENEPERMRDRNEFRGAVQEFTNVSLELDRLEKERENKKKVAQFRGEQIAVSIASIIAAFLILMLLSSQFS